MIIVKEVVQPDCYQMISKGDNMEGKLKQEAIRRMRNLKLHDDGQYTCLPDFEKNNNVWKSEFHGILYWLDDEEKELVKKFEEKHKEHKVMVYHCYKAHTEFGEILYMLYVSNQKGEDKEFDADLEDGIIFCYAANITDPCFSEFGSAYIKSQFGGIVIQ